MLASRRWVLLVSSLGIAALLYNQLSTQDASSFRTLPSLSSVASLSSWSLGTPPNAHDWTTIPQNYPITTGYAAIPSGNTAALPSIQAQPAPETSAEKLLRLQRQAAVKAAFEHSWAGYKKYAWGEDEVIPVEGGFRTVWGGWAATMVDSLDTLWIMGLKTEFHAAVRQVALTDFTKASISSISVFETTIRFLGGLLSAYDLSGEKVLLRKATDLGNMLYHAFDTPNRMPISRWMWSQ